MRHNKWLHGFALLTAAMTLGLVCIGGLVTSRGAGMAVPDWPTSYGYNMFFFPISKWTGGIFYEHTHRLWATLVGVLVVGLTRWLGGWRSRPALAVIGAIEVLAGIALPRLGDKWSGGGHFLVGIGGVVLLAALVWARNEPAKRPLPLLGWLAFAAVQVQGLLGGLRVVLYSDSIGIFHATLAQMFFVLTGAIALLTSRWWQGAGELCTPEDKAGRLPKRWALATTFLILAQLVVGAAMRHQHAGLAIPDFPLAYGRFWPAMDSDSVARYNQNRVETTAVNPITAGQIGLQMAHRLMALAILAGVLTVVLATPRRLDSQDAPEFPALRRLSMTWLGFIAAQIALGAATIWTGKAADVATAHVFTGALCLLTGALWCVIAFRRSVSSTLPQAKSAPLDVLAANSMNLRPAISK